MDSCSENSFAWTDTSSDSFNSSSKDAVEIHLKSPEKTELVNPQTMKYKENNSSLENQEDEELKTNIKEENYEEKSMSSHKKKKVKLEPDSENEISKKKLKLNFEINGKKHESQNSESYDETYLDMQVKQEESSISSSTKKKKSKKKRRPSVDSDISTTSTELKSTIHNAFNTSSELKNLPETKSETGRIKIKKKKKKSKDIYHHSEDDIEDKIDIEETIICKQDVCNKTHDKHSKVNHSLVRESSLEEESDESGCNEISAIKCDNDITHTISFIDKTLDKTTTGMSLNNSLGEKTLSNHLMQTQNKVPETIPLNVADSTKQRTPRISERILFEDDDDDTVSSPVHDIDYSSSKNMKKTKQFLKGNPNLKLVTEQFYDSSNLTQDDEIWILKCPKEIEIGGFIGKKINIHGKCKIKFDGQTYDGNAEENIQSNTVTVLSMEHKKYKIRNLPLNGIISLRKRIPKSHFHDNNVMVNNQTNFIPLPETKCRHPLLGSNYKKALKIPASIAERLNVQDTIEATMKTEKRKKKKQKLDKIILEHDNQEVQETIMKTEPDFTINVSEKKKKKKRKITDDEGPTPKKVKRIKHDPESAEAWESEKAIEENLFNY